MRETRSVFIASHPYYLCLGEAMIEAVGLSKFYGDFAATRDVSFSIPRGQVCAFLRAQRRGQINHDEIADRLRRAHGGRGAHCGGSTYKRIAAKPRVTWDTCPRTARCIRI